MTAKLVPAKRRAEPAPISVEAPSPTNAQDGAQTPPQRVHQSRTLRPLRPSANVRPERNVAPPQLVQCSLDGKTCFLDLPPELRIAIYKLALDKIIVRIDLPGTTSPRPTNSLPLVSKQVSSEVRQVMYQFCPVETRVTNFDFKHVHDWQARLQNNDNDKALGRNKRLRMQLQFTGDKSQINTESLRRWLHDRADPYRTQIPWNYTNAANMAFGGGVAVWLRRRHDRMKEGPERVLFRAMVTRAGVHVFGPDGRAEWDRAKEDWERGRQELLREQAPEE